MTARQKAIDALNVAYHDPAIDSDVVDAGAFLLGAIPDDVLVRYAIERGALIPTGKSHWTGPDARRHVDQYAPTYFAKAHR